MKFNAGNKVAGAGKGPTKHTKVGLRVVEEQLPPNPYHRKMVSPSGSVKRVVLSTGRTIGGEASNAYGAQELAEKLSKGWLLYSECPLAHGLRLDGETVCDGINPDRPGVFWTRSDHHPNMVNEDTCCRHVKQAIEERQADHAEKQEELDRRYQTKHERLLEKVIANAVEQTTDQKRKPGRPRLDV